MSFTSPGSICSGFTVISGATFKGATEDVISNWCSSTVFLIRLVMGEKSDISGDIADISDDARWDFALPNSEYRGLILMTVEATPIGLETEKV